MGADGHACLGEGASDCGELEQAEDAGVEGKLDDDPPDSPSCCLRGFQEAPRPPVEEDAEHQEDEVDVVQVDEFGHTHGGNGPYDPDNLPNEDGDVPAGPPVHPEGCGPSFPGHLRGFVQFNPVGQFRRDLERLLRTRVHPGYQKGDDEQDDHEQDEIKRGEYCISCRDGGIQNL